MNIVNYSEQSFVVLGNTKEHKETLKKLGGKWNARLKCGAGWIFSNKHRETVTKELSEFLSTDVAVTLSDLTNDYKQDYLSTFEGDDAYTLESAKAFVEKYSTFVSLHSLLPALRLTLCKKEHYYAVAFVSYVKILYPVSL